MSDITIDNFHLFREAFNKALKEKKKVFQFSNTDVDIEYGKYVIQYFESQASFITYGSRNMNINGKDTNIILN